jgi:hypothetical protein
MKRRQFLRHATALPILGGGIAAATVVQSETSVKEQIEHHIQALRDLIDQTKPEGVGDTALIIRNDSWDAQEGGLGKILNPHSLRWS